MRASALFERLTADAAADSSPDALEPPSDATTVGDAVDDASATFPDAMLEGDAQTTMPDAATDASVSDASSGEGNDSCTLAQSHVLGTIVTANTCNATDTFSESCAAAGTPELFYTFSQPANSSHTMSLSSGFVVAAYAGNQCSNFNPICDMNGLTFTNSTGGSQDWIIAIAATSGCGIFSFSLLLRPQPG